jgi:hypothetical protein
MTEAEATAKANDVMSVVIGTGAAPSYPAEFKSVGGRRTWTICYKGYTVKVIDKSGDVSVFENGAPKHTF